MSIATTDPIADMLTRIRNAISVRKSEVVLPHSKTKEAVAQLLKVNGFISDVKSSDAAIGKMLTIVINPSTENPRITEIVRMSRPGRRHYANAKAIPTVKQGRGMIIVSTSKGMMTGAEAKAEGIGGELICKVY